MMFGKKPRWPKSARKLLEARYQAFVDGDVDFIMESIHPQVRQKHDRKSIESWSKESKWLGFTIENEKIEGDKAFISFMVQYEQDGQVIDHQENAEFRMVQDRWYFYNSTYPQRETYRREGEKIGRNDPCPCGSGKKYKKCCGAS